MLLNRAASPLFVLDFRKQLGCKKGRQDENGGYFGQISYSIIDTIDAILHPGNEKQGLFVITRQRLIYNKNRYSIRFSAPLSERAVLEISEKGIIRLSLSQLQPKGIGD